MLKIGIATVVAIVGLAYYNSGRIDAGNFALGKETQTVVEEWNGVPLTAHSIDSIKQLAARQGANSKTTSLDVWIGNSQLHAINQLKSGDHTAPYWLTQSTSCSGCKGALGVSLASANPQEQLVIAQFMTEHVNASTLILKLVFQNWREDGLREDFAAILTPELRQTIEKSTAGLEILGAWDSQHMTKSGAVPTENEGLTGFVQKDLEDFLSDRLGRVFPLWADRPNLRAHLSTDLWHARNAVLGIKPTTVRKTIRPRYEKNMRAYRALLEHAAARGVRLLVYVAPIRQDLPIPYDPGEYTNWKREVSEWADKSGSVFLDLDDLVPAKHWGTYNTGSKEEVDFMHFQGEGHALLATRIAAALKATGKKAGN